MISKLDLYSLDSDGNVAPFPSVMEQLVLYDFSREAQRMGSAPEITATIQANGSLENLLTTKVFCECDGERYFLKNTPSSSKDNTDPRYTFELTFVSERTILDNVYMIDAVQGNSGLDRYQSNSTNVVFMGDINEAVARLNAAMAYKGVGYSVVIDSGITTEDKQVSFENKYFTEVLQEYAQIYGVPYYFVGKVAHFGWAQYDVPTVKYGDGLLSISKDIQNTRIINSATATGSSDNLPYYYPNPTPRGFITYSVPNGITVNSEHKLALLPVGSSLIYIPETQEIAIKGTYGFGKITDRQPDFSVSDQYATLIIPQYDSSNGQIVSGPVALLKNTFPESKDFAIDLVVRHPKGTLVLTPSVENPMAVIPTTPIACTKVDDALVEDTSVIVSVASSNTVASEKYANDEETTFRLNVSGFPAGEERYIFLRFLNPSPLRSDSKIFQFSFSVSERGLLQGWHIQDSNGITDEKVVNATDYGLRVGDNFAGGTVSYSVKRKIPYATTLMPPIYRESNGEQRFYNAINGAYEGIIFENEYSAENPKEGITKFEDIKPSIKGITNALGFRIDMFSAFEYDLNDNDNTVLVDGNTEEYQHPYFYAKLRKLDGAYGFNLFDQALESGEMTVSMTSGVCGACKFTIMVDKNTQRNLVMVDDNGNLMRDASGNVMMATDARGLDKQNDTINNEVWVALKKDISTFGQIMPNVEYNHYPDTSDTFVLLHILMPEVYIKAAEERLKTAIIDYLVANNSAQFNSGINFSRIYLHNNPEKVAILTENSRISIDYNDKLYSYFISSVTYRKAKAEVLPEISVELTQDIQPTTSNIQTAINAITITQQQVTEIVDKSEKQPKYLKSDTADTAQGKITFEKGLDFADNLNTKDFKQGAIDGKGFGVYSDSQGRVIVEADKVISRQGGYGGSGSGINNYVTTDTEQNITAHKNFEDGISMYGIPWEYDAERDAWTIKGNVIITKGLATYSTLKEDDVLSIFDGLPIDGRAIIWANGVLTVNPEMVGGLDEDALKDYLDTNKYATQTWVEEKNYLTEELLGERFVTLDTEQIITGLKDFTGGFKINSVPISYDAEKNAIVLPTNVIIEGGLATYTRLEGFKDLGIMAAIEVDGRTISKDGGILHVIGDVGGVDEDAVNELISDALVGYATQSWVNNKGYALQATSITAGTGLTGGGTLAANRTLSLATIGTAGTYTKVTTDAYGRVTSGATLSASDIPNLSWSKITSGKPTTLSGYGITNAYTKIEADDRYLPINGIADRAKILAGSLTDTSYLLFNSNELNHCNNGNTNRFWFGYRTPSGSSRSTNKWLFGSSALTARADGEVWAGKVYIGDTLGDFKVEDFKAPLHVNGSAYIGGTFYLNGAPMTYNSSKNAWQLEGNLIVTGGLATYTKLSGFTNLDVMGGIVVDNDTIYINSAGQLAVKGGTSGGSVSITGAASTIVSSNLTASRALVSNSSGKVAVSSITSTKLGYLTDVTSNIQAQINGKQATLVSGTNIKTINGTSILGSGNITISGSASGDYLPITGGDLTGRLFLTSSASSAFSNAQLVFGPRKNARISSNDNGTLYIYSPQNIYLRPASVTATSNLGVTIDTSGNVTVTGSVTENSDRKLKNIEYEGEGFGLDVLKKVKVAKWKWKDNNRDKRTHIGGVADNLVEIMPEVVFESEDEDGTITSSIAYGKAGFSIAASLIAPVVRHEDRIKELEKNIEKMQQELKQLKSA